MIHAIASLFRTLNTKLLDKRGLTVFFLKGSYWASVQIYKWWIRKRRPDATTTIHNYDRRLKIKIDISKSMGAALYWTGFHEFNEMRFLHSYLKPDMTFIDVGANQGEYSLFASQRVPEGCVLAFEPLTVFFERLAFNIQLNSLNNVKTFKLGLSDRVAQVPIYLNANNAQNHEGLGSLFPVSEDDVQSEVIHLAILDEVLAGVSVERVDFIKIDVEGSEWAVLKGSVQVLTKHKPALMIELNRETAAKAGLRVEDMINWLRQRGYQPYHITKHGLKAMAEVPAFCNAVFLTR